MQVPINKRREEVATVIRSCLISRPGDVTIKMLDRDYEEFEGEPIPFREFNCPSLLVFLNQLRNTLWVEKKGAQVIVHPVDSEKSRHISSLVERQRPKNSDRRMSRKPYCGFSGGRIQISINSSLMMNLIRLVKQYQKGLTIDWAVHFVNRFYSPVQITRQELERQLREISHEVIICGNSLYPANRIPFPPPHSFNHIYPRVNQSSQSTVKGNSQRLNNSKTETLLERRSSIEPMQKSNGKKELPTRDKDDDKDDGKVKFLPAGFAFSSEAQEAEKIERLVCHAKNKEKTSNEQILNRGKQNSLSETSFTEDQDLNGKEDRHINEDSFRRQHLKKDQDSHLDDERSSKKTPHSNQENQKPSLNLEKSPQNFLRHGKESSSNSHSSHEDKTPSMENNENYKDKNLLKDGFEEDLSHLIEVSTKNRLAKLIHQYPDGIWCTDLPKTYLETYKTPLIYSELGFDSIRDFASHLPKIFHCVRPTNAKDYKLCNAEKPPPDLRNKKQPTNQTLTPLHQIYDESEALPHKLDASTSRMLLPEGVMGIGESVGPISVTELGGDEGHEEVKITEVFSPSFFWIQLRRKLTKFRKFMDELNTFYEKNQSKYKIPLILLEKGLNVVCFSDEKWQRGIIKTVFPDERTTINFYDCGTEKVFAPDEIYFLHRSFSYLAAQAIPCGLYNVKPYQASKWSKSITWEFISKTSIPLIATIGTINVQENSMLVSLTDTRGEEDFHINDWMYDEKFGEQGHIFFKKRNFAFLYYKECLERKGYDSSSVHSIRSKHLKLDKSVKFVENIPVKITPAESKPEESKPGPLRLRRTQTLLAQYQANKEEEDLQDSKSPWKKTPTSAEYENTFETPQVSKSSKSTSFKSESKTEILKRFLMNQSLKAKDCAESADCQAPLEKANLESEFRVESLKSPALKSLNSNLITNTSNSISIPIHSSLLLKELPKEKREQSYFGTTSSECIGNARMEPINWTELRSTLINREDQSSIKAKMDLKAKALEIEVPLVNSCVLNVVNNDLNSTYYDKNVHWVPGNNFSTSRSTKSSLLNLKERIHANSFKEPSILITSKVLGILKGESQDSEDDASLKPINKSEEKIQDQEEEISEQKQKVDQSRQKTQLPPKIRRLLELQSKIKVPITEQIVF